MNQEEINKKFLERLEKIEKVIFSEFEVKEKHKKIIKKKGKAEDLKLPIQKLFDGGFFKEAKIDKDVFSELQKKLLTRQKPLRSSVVNALRDMVRKEILERVDVVQGKKVLIGYKNKS